MQVSVSKYYRSLCMLFTSTHKNAELLYSHQCKQAQRNYAGFFFRLCGDFRQIMRRIARNYAGLRKFSQVPKLKTNVKNFPRKSHKSGETRVLFG